MDNNEQCKACGEAATTHVEGTVPVCEMCAEGYNLGEGE